MTDRLADRELSQSRFDRLAEPVSDFVSRGVFFAACLGLVVIWALSYFAIGDVNTWQLVINTITTIVTFLLVALLQNTQRRSEQVLQEKLNAIADGLADLMDHEARGETGNLEEDMQDLRTAAGLEQRT